MSKLILRDTRITPPNQLLEYLPRWMNNSRKHLGILYFGWDLFPDLILHQYGIADWVYTAMNDIMHYEPGMRKEDRCFVIATYRSGSKTTWLAHLFELYNILIGQYGVYWENNLVPAIDYQVLKAKTGSEAKKRLYNISRSFNRQILVDLFGKIKPTFNQTKNREGKETSNLLICSNDFIIEAGGIGQPSRGLNVIGKRPKSFMYDDPENNDNTKTAERRENNRREVMEEAFGAIDDDGLLIYVGNKVHSDDCLGKLLDNNRWKSQFHTWSFKDKNGVERSAWAKRYTLEYIHKRKKWFEDQPEMGGLRAFYKEYYNKIVSEVEYKLNTHTGTIVFEHGANWLVTIDPTGNPVYKNVNLYIGNDPAISESKRTSNAVVMVVAIDTDGNRYVIEYTHGKLDIHDRYYDETKRPALLAKTALELTNVRRRGSVEEIARYCLKYKVSGITIEVLGQQRTFFNETKELLERLNIAIPILPYTSHVNKIDKLREVPLCYFEAGKYYLGENHHALRSEIEVFPYSKNDLLDSLHLTEQLMKAPVAMAYHPFGATTNKTNKTSGTNLEYIPHKAPGSVLYDHESWITA